MSVVELCREDEIAVVLVDDPPVNALKHEVRVGLLNAFSQARDDPEIAAIVLTCAGRTFIAGADITEFDKPPKSPHLSEVIALIETIQKPVVAAIHGTALGGRIRDRARLPFRSRRPARGSGSRRSSSGSFRARAAPSGCRA